MTNPKLEVLTPQNSQLIFIDHQPQMAFGVQSIDRQTLKNNVVALAKAAKVFKIPTTITTVETQSFSGYTYPELLDVFPDKPVLERTSMNSWDDKKVRDALKANGRNKVDHRKENRCGLPGDRMVLEWLGLAKADAAHLRPVIETLQQ
jgi:nicotinamidase-related amidase